MKEYTAEELVAELKEQGYTERQIQEAFVDALESLGYTVTDAEIKDTQ